MADRIRAPQRCSIHPLRSFSPAHGTGSRPAPRGHDALDSNTVAAVDRSPSVQRGPRTPPTGGRHGYPTTSLSVTVGGKHAPRQATAWRHACFTTSAMVIRADAEAPSARLSRVEASLRDRVARALQRSYPPHEVGTALHVSPERVSRLWPPAVDRISLPDLVVLAVLADAQPLTITLHEECAQAVAEALDAAEAPGTDPAEEFAILIDGNGSFQVTSMFEAITGDWESPTQVWPLDNVLEAILGRLDGSRLG
jgi:hypothetical protein